MTLTTLVTLYLIPKSAPCATGIVGGAAVHGGAAGARVLQRDRAAGAEGVAAHPRVRVVYSEQAVHLRVPQCV